MAIGFCLSWVTCLYNHVTEVFYLLKQWAWERHISTVLLLAFSTCPFKVLESQKLAPETCKNWLILIYEDVQECLCCPVFYFEISFSEISALTVVNINARVIQDYINFKVVHPNNFLTWLSKQLKKCIHFIVYSRPFSSV